MLNSRSTNANPRITVNVVLKNHDIMLDTFGLPWVGLARVRVVCNVPIPGIQIKTADLLVHK